MANSAVGTPLELLLANVSEVGLPTGGVEPFDSRSAKNTS